MPLTERAITVPHNGKDYNGRIAKIESTSITYESHGILSSYLHCQWDGGGIGVGGYCLDQPKDRDSHDYSRVGTAYGLDYLIRVMETVGVSSWEDLKGSDVIVLFDGYAGPGGISVGIAGLLNDKVFILKEHAESWLSAAGAR